MGTEGVVEEKLEGSRLPVAGQRALEVLPEDWMPLWEKANRDEEGDPMTWEVSAEPLPRLTLNQLDAVLQCYSEK